MEFNQIYNTDALEGLKQLDENSIDAIISDPPYQLTSITRSRPDQTEDGEYGREVPFSRVQSRIKGVLQVQVGFVPLNTSGCSAFHLLYAGPPILNAEFSDTF